MTSSAATRTASLSGIDRGRLLEWDFLFETLYEWRFLFETVLRMEVASSQSGLLNCVRVGGRRLRVGEI